MVVRLPGDTAQCAVAVTLLCSCSAAREYERCRHRNLLGQRRRLHAGGPGAQEQIHHGFRAAPYPALPILHESCGQLWLAAALIIAVGPDHGPRPVSAAVLPGAPASVCLDERSAARTATAFLSILFPLPLRWLPYVFYYAHRACIP